MGRPLLIAEIGINHGGNKNIAMDMVRRAKSAGADIAKFQWYRPREILGYDSPHLAEANKCQLEIGHHRDIKALCDEIGIEWCCSIFHADQVSVVDGMDMRRYKVASRAAGDMDLLREIAMTGKPVVMSTGLASQRQMDRAVDLFRKFGNSLTLLYCVSLYPCRKSDVDLSEIRRLGEMHGTPVGFSSHCPDYRVSVDAAINWGAVALENHVIPTRPWPGCDASSSITFREFMEMSDAIAAVKTAS